MKKAKNFFCMAFFILSMPVFFLSCASNAHGNETVVFVVSPEMKYEEAKEDFDGFLKKSDSNGPFILLGYLQGGDIAVRLCQDYASSLEFIDRLVAVYAIGCDIAEDDIVKMSPIHLSTGENETGVIVCCDAVTDIVPYGIYGFSEIRVPSKDLKENMALRIDKFINGGTHYGE